MSTPYATKQRSRLREHKGRVGPNCNYCLFSRMDTETTWLAPLTSCITFFFSTLPIIDPGSGKHKMFFLAVLRANIQSKHRCV